MEPSPSPGADHPAWPAELDELFERSVTVEFTSLTSSGRPVTVPTTPYVGRTGRTLDVSTGLTYPAKAERARRNPKVSLLYADPVGSGLEAPPVALVQGLATVRDADLQANTDRYVRESMAKLPAATKGKPRLVLKRMAWYFARIWIEVTPVRIWWWDDRTLSSEPRSWNAPEGTSAPPSDPPPPGANPPAWLSPPADWEPVAADAFTRLEMVDLSVVGVDGFPVCVPVRASSMGIEGFTLEAGKGALPILRSLCNDEEPRGVAACLTFHGHPEEFTGQENRSFVGTLEAGSRPCVFTFRVERALADWSLAGGQATVALGFLAKGRRLRPRLVAEAARRMQPVPKVRFKV